MTEAGLPAWWANPARASVTWPRAIDSTGESGPTRGQARGPTWTRSSYGFYVPSSCAMTPEQRIATAMPLLTRWCTGVTGWAALRWLGAGWFEGTTAAGEPLPVDIMTSGFFQRGQAGFQIREERLWVPDDVVYVDGLTVTSPVRTVLFLMRYARGVRHAVRLADMAAYNDLVSIAELVEYAGQLNGWTGVGQARAALPLCDENAWSPTEVDFRLTWTHDAGLPRPLTNTPIFDRHGNHIGTPDLVDPIAGVLGDYDGVLHLEGAQRTRDVRREALFRRHGLEYVTMLSSDLADRGPVTGRLLEAYRRADRLPVSERSWTVQPPAWWQPTTTVAQRRALSTRNRDRLLKTRRRAA